MPSLAQVFSVAGGEGKEDSFPRVSSTAFQLHSKASLPNELGGRGLPKSEGLGGTSPGLGSVRSTVSRSKTGTTLYPYHS